MILTILILIYLILSTIRGWRMGLIRQIVTRIIHLMSLFGAIFLQGTVGEFVYQKLFVGQGLEQFYTLVSRFIAFFALWFIFRIMFGFIQRILFPRKHGHHGLSGFLNALLGAALSFVCSYLWVFLLISMFHALNVSWFETQLINSPCAQFILNETPVLTNLFNQFFIDHHLLTK
ncbi:MAG: CvpA family protein [Lactobacillus sp.]|nr:CvpA family protein [Lactobacillus sp.]